MKKFLLFALLAFIIGLNSILTFGQTGLPKGINYQAVAREKNGKPISNKDLIVEIVLINLDTEEKIYSEEHHVTTNKFGLFTLVIGQGKPDFDQDFNKVDWSLGSINVVASIDFGKGLQQVGSVALQAVPYAFMADSALKAPRQQYRIGELTDVVTDSLRVNQVLAWNGINWIPASTISVSKLSSENINLSGHLGVNGNAIVSDTLVVESFFSSSGMVNNLLIRDNADINKNLSVGKNLVVSGSLTSDTLKAKYLKIDNIEGYLSGRVSDVSNHNVTEMQGISEVGSGKIITEAERTLLNSIPSKAKSDSIKFEEKLISESNSRYAKDSMLLIKLDQEKELLNSTDSLLCLKIINDSLSLTKSVRKEEHLRDSSDLNLSSILKNHQEKLTELAANISLEKEIQKLEDSAAIAGIDSSLFVLNSKLLTESDSRNEADLLLHIKIRNEQSDRKATVDSIYNTLKADIDNNYLEYFNFFQKWSLDSSNVRRLIKAAVVTGQTSDSLLNEKIKFNTGILDSFLDTVQQAIYFEAEERNNSDSIIGKKLESDSSLLSRNLAIELLNRQKSDSTLSASLELTKKFISKKTIELRDSIENEKQRRRENIEEIKLKIQGDSILTENKIGEEILNRKTADSEILEKMLVVSRENDSTEKNLKLEIENEKVKRQISDELLVNKIKEDSLDVNLKINDIKLVSLDQINNLQDAINIETSQRIESTNNVLDSLNSERKNRNTSEFSIKNKIFHDSALLKHSIDIETSLRSHIDDSISLALNKEAEYRNSNYTALSKTIQIEEAQRKSSDNNLSYRIISDSLKKENSDILLDNKINNETNAREVSDNKLEHLIKDGRSLKLSGAILSLNEAADTLNVNLSSINTDHQAISYDNANHILLLENGGSVDLSTLKNDNDADPVNELNSNVSLNGSILEITDAGGTKSVDLAKINTDSQHISYNPQTHILTLQNGGAINLSGFFNSSVILNGSNLEITDGSGTKLVDISPVNTDNQQLSLADNKLSISGGDTVIIPYASNSQSGLIKRSDWNNFNNKPGPGLNSGQIWVGNPDNMAEPATVTGDASLVHSGTLTISNNAITSSKINNGAVTSEKLNSMGASSGQVLRYNGSSWQPSTDNSEYTSGNGIAIVDNAIVNTSPDKTVKLSGADGIGITGNYPDFIITNTNPNINHAGDVTGSDFLTISPNAVTAVKIEDKAITGSKLNRMGAANGQVLKYNGTTWSPASDSCNNYYAGNGIGILNSYIFNTLPDKIVTLNGDAGISINGKYPDFNIVNSSPNANHTGNVTGATVLTISDNAVTTSKIADNTVTAIKLNSMGASSGQVLKFNGVNWGPSYDNNSVYTGGAGINVSGSVIINSLPDKIVNISGGTGIEIMGSYPDFTITNSQPNMTHTGDVIGTDSLKIANNAVTTPKILDGAVTNSKLDRMGAEEGQVLKWKSTHWVPAVANQTEYVAGDGIKITGTIVENTKPNENHNGDVSGWRTLTIANNAVTNQKLRDSAVTTSKLAFKSVTEDKISNNAVSNSKILNGSISTDKLANSAVTKDKINENSVDSTKIDEGSIAGFNLSQSSVSEEKIASMAVTTAKLNDNAVTSAKILDGSVSTDDLKNGAVTEAKLADDAITTSKIMDEAVTLMKLSKAKAASGKVIKFTGQNWDVGEDENTTYTQGVGIQISGARITNTAPNATHTGDVTGSETLTIADNVIDSSNINTGSISNSNLKHGSISGDRLNRMGALNSQVLTFSNGTWAPVDNNSHLHLSSQISDATADNATDKIVMRDAWGNFSAGTITATLNGGASYAMQSEKWSTPRTVTLQGGVTGAASLDGSKNVIISTTVVDNSHQHLSSNISDATDLASAGKVVKRDMNGNFSAKLIYADLDGTASRSNTADNAAKADIAKVSDKLTNSLTLNLGSELGGNVSFFGNEGAVSLNATVTNAVSANTPDAIVRRTTGGNFSAGTITASLNGNASTASKWQTRRTFSLIGGVTGSNNEIDGSGDAVISCTVANNSHSHISSNISDATYENVADKIVKRSSNGFFDAGGANIGNLNTAYNNNLNVYGITNFYSKLNSSSSASFIKVSQCSDNSSDISPGASTTGHLGYYNKWKDINVKTLNSDELTSTNGTISTLNSTNGSFSNVTSSYGTITNLSSSSATIAGSLIGSTYNGSLTINGRLYLTVGRDRSDNPVTLTFYHGSENNGQEMKIIPSTGCFDLGSASHTFATIYCYSLIENSDRRIKENITPLFGALEKILKLRAVKFDLKSGFYPTNDPYAGKNRIGFIAQEVLEIIPQAVHFDSSSNLYGIKYDNIIPFLTKAIQEQQNTIDSLRIENKENEDRIANLEKRLFEIERKLK